MPVSFLEQCQKSSQESYEAFKAILSRLENSETRIDAVKDLHGTLDALKEKYSTDEMMKKFNFAVSELKLKNASLKLLLLPSTFAPESWSFTFYEGLSRYKASEFTDRNVIELGCGIGWISIALAMQTRPRKIYGLDINPRAVTCARINLYINSYDNEGKPRYQGAQQNLDELVEFHVSDLYEYCLSKQIAIDRVIGCIPQVLNPDPEFTAKILSGDLNENVSDEFLQSLSNYAPQQGQIEDQFGLGLIARAVEESVLLLKNTGKIILNLGGRPGKKVLEQLFLRRGFAVKQVWQTQVEQAKDTDIRKLVDIENKSTHRFEFYIEKGGATPISAHAALTYANAGGRISHGLMVFEARMRDPVHLPQILRTLSKEGFESARNALDLSYSEEALIEEKSSFLSALSLELEKTEYFAYQRTAGFTQFRENLGLFFKRYFRINFTSENFVITPSRIVTCRNIISMFKPKRILVDKVLHSENFRECPDVIEVPAGSDLLCEMISKLKPQLVFYSMPEVEARTSDVLIRIIEVSARTKTRVVIDISDFFELSSSPATNGLFRFFETQLLPAHVSLMCGLVKNQIYSDLQACFVISEDVQFLNHLVNAAELTYSRTPFLSQFYYNCILNDLLSFQVLDETLPSRREQLQNECDTERGFITVATQVEAAFSSPAIVGERQAQMNESLLRLDYGENCIASPELLKFLLLEAFAHKNLSSDKSDSLPEIYSLIQRRWSLPKTERLSGLLSGGVAPIFAEIASHCSRSGGSLLFPNGSYGYFVAAAEFFGAKVARVYTEESRGFKIQIENLKKVLAETKEGSFIILSAPIVNPTGAIYSVTEIRAIAEVAQKYKAVLVLDSVFSGLGFCGSALMPASEEVEVMSEYALQDCQWLILGGISKEYAAGGLRVGYVVTNRPPLLEPLKACELTKPHKTLEFVFKQMLQEQAVNLSALSAQRMILKRRAEELTQVLEETGWKVQAPKGGLFLIATPKGLIGRVFQDSSISVVNVSELLLKHFGLVINSPEWIGIPNYFRFVLSVTETEFIQALNKLREFYRETKLPC